MTDPGPVLGVVIVSWNVRDLLCRGLDSLRGGTVPLRIVVVDNASADGSVDTVSRDFPEVCVLANSVNVGFTRGNNQGLRLLGLGDPSLDAPPYILLLNPDAEVVGDAVASLAGYLDDHPAVGAVGPELRYPDGTIQSSRRRFPSLLTGLVESTPLNWHWPGNPVSRRYRMADDAPAAGPVDWVTGAAMLLRTAALEAVGLFDEGFFMYAEELDLCRRLWAAGWEVHFEPRSRVVHHEGASSSQVVPARHLHFQRSRVRYFRKHHGRLAATVVRGGILAAFALETLLEVVKWLVGHRRPLRRARVAAYWALLRDGLSPAGTGAAP